MWQSRQRSVRSWRDQTLSIPLQAGSGGLCLGITAFARVLKRKTQLLEDVFDGLKARHKKIELRPMFKTSGRAFESSARGFQARSEALQTVSELLRARQIAKTSDRCSPASGGVFSPLSELFKLRLAFKKGGFIF